jgi:hypothetical protein
MENLWKQLREDHRITRSESKKNGDKNNSAKWGFVLKETKVLRRPWSQSVFSKTAVHNFKVWIKL